MRIYRYLIPVILLAALLAPARPVLANSTVVGSGTPASCTEAALHRAVSGGGLITFNCGPQPHTILLTRQVTLLELPQGTILDGGGLITLDGQGKTRILFTRDLSKAVIRNITLQNGYVDYARSGPPFDFNGRGAALQTGWKSQTTLFNVTLRNNRAMSDDEICAGGGAVWTQTYSRLWVYNSRFENNFARNGGAINNLLSDLVIANSVFVNNRAEHNRAINNLPSYDCGGGGAVYIDGARPAREGGSANIQIINTVFDGNWTNHRGGAIVAFIYPGDNMAIEDAVFRGNQAVLFDDGEKGGTGGAVWFGGKGDQINPLVFRDSTLSGNHAGLIGGGFWAHKPAALTNVTIANNTSKNSIPAGGSTGRDLWKQGIGGGMVMGAGSSLTNVTIMNNRAGWTGGGIGILGVDDLINAAITNSIIANNTADGPVYHQNCAAAFVDRGGNLQYPARTQDHRDTNCTAQIAIADPRLQPLADNGGFSQTAALGRGSPAVDAGVSAACPPADQREYARAGRCDSGAFEYGGQPIKVGLAVFLPLVGS